MLLALEAGRLHVVPQREWPGATLWPGVQAQCMWNLIRAAKAKPKCFKQLNIIINYHQLSDIYIYICVCVWLYIYVIVYIYTCVCVVSLNATLVQNAVSVSSRLVMFFPANNTLQNPFNLCSVGAILLAISHSRRLSCPEIQMCLTQV